MAHSSCHWCSIRPSGSRRHRAGSRSPRAIRRVQTARCRSAGAERWTTSRRSNREYRRRCRRGLDLRCLRVWMSPACACLLDVGGEDGAARRRERHDPDPADATAAAATDTAAAARPDRTAAAARRRIGLLLHNRFYFGHRLCAVTALRATARPRRTTALTRRVRRIRWERWKRRTWGERWKRRIRRRRCGTGGVRRLTRALAIGSRTAELVTHALHLVSEHIELRVLGTFARTVVLLAGDRRQFATQGLKLAVHLPRLSIVVRGHTRVSPKTATIRGCPLIGKVIDRSDAR